MEQYVTIIAEDLRFLGGNEAHLNVQVLSVLPKELYEVLVLEQRALLDDLQVGLGALKQVDLLEEEVADLRHRLKGGMRTVRM